MSWSGSCQEVGEQVEVESFSLPPEPWTDEVRDQIETALAAVQSVIDSGAVGDGPYSVTVAGHANPDHEPTAGWANDGVSLSIYQQTRP